MSIKSSSRGAAVLALASAFVLGGCGVEPAGDEAGRGEASGLASTEQAVISGWTPYTFGSDSPSGPISCDDSSLVNGVECTGDYCHGMRFFCQATLFGVRGTSYWTSFFSDENKGQGLCGDGYWVTGLKCTGTHCDNLSLQCTAMSNITAKNCYWTGWYSDEDGPVYFPVPSSAYYLKGAQCSGHYCDSLKYYICQL